MSKWEKLLMKIESLDKNLRFEELRKVLEAYGYEMNMPKGGSSHATFRKRGNRSVTIPKSDPIKVVYVELVKHVVEQEEKKHENS